MDASVAASDEGRHTSEDREETRTLEADERMDDPDPDAKIRNAQRTAARYLCRGGMCRTHGHRRRIARNGKAYRHGGA
jgi:hypothetical protein